MRRYSDKLAVVCTALSILCAIVVVLVVAPTVLDTSGRTGEVERLSAENAQRIREIARLAKAIQVSRKDSLITTCRDTNTRHHNVIAQLDREIARAAKTETSERVQQMRRQRAGTVRLLSVILPVTNCEERAKRLVEPPPAP